MAVNNHAACHAVTAKYEGGWSNHPNDPGGATMKGVIQRVYDAYRKRKGLATQSVRLISDAELNDIYRNDYWIPSGCESMQKGVDLTIYDWSVNSGVGRGRKAYAATAGVVGAPQRVKKICADRRAFFAAIIARNGKLAAFRKGWANRVAGVEAIAYKWALTAQGMNPAVIKTQMQAEAAGSKQVAASKDKQAKAAGSGAVAAPAPVAAAGGWDWDMIFFGLAIAGVLGFISVLAIKAKQAQGARAQAFLVEADTNG